MQWDPLADGAVAVAPYLLVGLYFLYQRGRRRRWSLYATAEFDERTTCEASGDRWTGTLGGLSWTLFVPTTRGRPWRPGALRVRVDAHVGWRATARGGEPSALDGPLGDPRFDELVVLHDDAGSAAAVLTPTARAAVTAWVRAGGEVDAAGVEVPLDWTSLVPEELFPWLRAQVAIIRALTLPDDPRAALVARLSDKDQTTRLFAAASLGADVPQDLRRTVLADVWERLAAPHPPPFVVDLLTRLEVRGDDATGTLVALLGSPQPGVTPLVIRALGSLGTADAIMPLLHARPGPLGDARVRAAVDASLAAIRGTLKGIEGGRLAVAPDVATRGALSVVDGAAEAGRVFVADDGPEAADASDEGTRSLAELYAAAKAGGSTGSKRSG